MNQTCKPEDFVSSCGLIKEMSTFRYHLLPDLWYTTAMTVAPHSKASIYGTGVSLNKVEAENKAIGEVFERYASYIVPHKKLYYGSANALSACGKKFAKSEWLQFFSPYQLNSPNFPFEAFNSEAAYWWVDMEDISSGEQIWIPAEMVYLSDQIETRLQYPISSGLASHISKKLAFGNALYEVIERDAFMIMWKRKVSVPQIELESIPDPQIQHILKFFFCARISVQIFDITLEHGIPTVFAVGTNRYGAVAVSAAAHLDFTTSIYKCLLELEIGCRWVDLMDRKLQDGELHDLPIMDRHLATYLDRSKLVEFDFLNESPTFKFAALAESKYQIDKMRELTDEVVSQLTRCGFTILLKDVTPRDVAQAGRYVYKVIVPEMVPIDVGIPYDGVARLYNLPPIKWSYCNYINQAIHPFP